MLPTASAHQIRAVHETTAKMLGRSTPRSRRRCFTYVDWDDDGRRDVNVGWQGRSTFRNTRFDFNARLHAYAEHAGSSVPGRLRFVPGPVAVKRFEAAT